MKVTNTLPLTLQSVEDIDDKVNGATTPGLDIPSVVDEKDIIELEKISNVPTVMSAAEDEQITKVANETPKVTLKQCRC